MGSQSDNNTESSDITPQSDSETESSDTILLLDNKTESSDITPQSVSETESSDTIPLLDNKTESPDSTPQSGSDNESSDTIPLSDNETEYPDITIQSDTKTEPSGSIDFIPSDDKTAVTPVTVITPVVRKTQLEEGTKTTKQPQNHGGHFKCGEDEIEETKTNYDSCASQKIGQITSWLGISGNKDDICSAVRELLFECGTELGWCFSEDQVVETRRKQRAGLETILSEQFRGSLDTCFEQEVETDETEVETVETEVKTVDTEVETVDTEVETVETDVETVDTEVETVKIDIKTVKTVVETVKTELEGVRKDLETVQGDGKTVTKDVPQFVERLLPDRKPKTLAAKSGSNRGQEGMSSSRRVSCNLEHIIIMLMFALAVVCIVP